MKEYVLVSHVYKHKNIYSVQASVIAFTYYFRHLSFLYFSKRVEMFGIPCVFYFLS